MITTYKLCGYDLTMKIKYDINYNSINRNCLRVREEGGICMRVYQTQRGQPKPLPKAGKRSCLQTEAKWIELPTGKSSHATLVDDIMYDAAIPWKKIYWKK